MPPPPVDRPERKSRAWLYGAVVFGAIGVILAFSGIIINAANQTVCFAGYCTGNGVALNGRPWLSGNGAASLAGLLTILGAALVVGAFIVGIVGWVLTSRRTG
jgi:hypothetical protein